MPYFSLLSAALSLYFIFTSEENEKRFFFSMFLHITQFYQSNDVMLGCTSVSFLSNSSNSASLILDRLRTSRFFWNKNHSWFKILFFFKRFLPQVWQHWCVTLWRSESCWCLIRASLLGNCLRQSRHANFVQSVNFCWTSAPSKSATPSSGSLSPL